MSELMIEDYLEVMEDMLENAQSALFAPKKVIVDSEQLRDCIDKIRMNIPSEIKQAQKIVQERKSINEEANKQAEMIITRAETRAKEMTDNNAITKAAQAKAAEIEKQARLKETALKNAADEYVTNALAKAEEALSASLNAVKRAKNAVKSPSQN